jgi:uncharacterized protein YrrD
MDVCTHDGKSLGSVDGVLIDPAERRIRHYVVQSTGWFGAKRNLVSAEQPVHIDHAAHVLRLEADAQDVFRKPFDPDSVRPFSDDDRLTAIFSTNAA